MRVLMAVIIVVGSFAPHVKADGARNCRRDSGRNRICVERQQPQRPRDRPQRCTETCRRNSRGGLVCKERCT